MDLSVKDASLILGVSENTVRNYIAWGKLPASLKDRKVVITEEDLNAFMQAESKAADSGGEGSAPEGQPVTLPLTALLPVIENLSALKQQVEEKFDLLAKNQALAQELREKERALVLKEREVERLQRDMAHRESLHQKEMENLEKKAAERLDSIREEAEARSAAERSGFEERLERERSALRDEVERDRMHFEYRLILDEDYWLERLAREKEAFAQKLAEARQREGLWAKLVKMMTWS